VVASVFKKVHALMLSMIELSPDDPQDQSQPAELEMYLQNSRKGSHRFCTVGSGGDDACVDSTRPSPLSSIDGQTGANDIMVTEIDDNVAASIVLFCGERSGQPTASSQPTALQGGAIHFPRTGIHVSATQSKFGALVIRYQHPTTQEKDPEDYIGEYAVCPVLSQESEGSMLTVVSHVLNNPNTT
jgi:hypothetical protein